MSDFDEEAERERLREKYERDEAEREVTQQMSELLLRGATMTNKHCETCSNPVFRYDDEEFCAVCNGQGGQAAGAEAGAESGDAQAAGDARTADDDRAAGAQSVDAMGGQEAEDSAGASARSDAAPQSGAASGAEARDRTAPAPPAPADDGVGSARESLVATLVALSERAATADDLGRQRALLAAAREAAEAVEAVDRVSR